MKNEKLKIAWEKFENKQFPSMSDNETLENMWMEIATIDSDIAGCMYTFLEKGYFWEEDGVKRKSIFYKCYDDLKKLSQKLDNFKPSNSQEKREVDTYKNYVEITVEVANEFMTEDKKIATNR